MLRQCISMLLRNKELLKQSIAQRKLFIARRYASTVHVVVVFVCVRACIRSCVCRHTPVLCQNVES